MDIKPDTIKPLEENTGGKLLDNDLGDNIFGLDTKSKVNKSKNKQVELLALHWAKKAKQTKLLQSKVNHQGNERQSSGWEKYLQILYKMKD